MTARRDGAGRPPTDGDPDRSRIRASLRIVGIGTAVAAVLALLTGLAGGSGRAGAAVLFLVAAVACGAASLHAVALLLADDLRGRDPSGWRAGLAAGLFVLAAALMAMVAGIGG